MVLVWLLRAAWIGATLPILITTIPSSSSKFHRLILGCSRRGKTLQSPPKYVSLVTAAIAFCFCMILLDYACGVAVCHSMQTSRFDFVPLPSDTVFSLKFFSLPQKYFCHFYILAFVWTTLLLVVTLLYAFKAYSVISELDVHSSGVSNDVSLSNYHLSSIEGNRIWRSVFLLLLMETQVSRRLFESIYVFKYSPSARMHIVGYLAGVFFYTAAPLSLCATEELEYVACSFVESVVGGKDRMQVQVFDLRGHIDFLLQLNWYAWVGAATFLWGWIHQRNCHLILGSLRDGNKKVHHYAIPYGDWFEYVSSPHYLAEIVIYGGLVIASGCTDINMWLLLIFVVANLSLAAAETHKWYLSKFENYPRNRFAIFPFVY